MGQGLEASIADATEQLIRYTPDYAAIYSALALLLLGIVAIAISAYLGESGYALDAANFPMG